MVAPNKRMLMQYNVRNIVKLLQLRNERIVWSLLCFLFILVQSVFAQTIFSKNGKYGIMDDENTVKVEAIYDSIFVPRFSMETGDGFVMISSDYETKYLEFYFTQKDSLFGFVSPHAKKGWFIAEPSYTSLHLIGAPLSLFIETKEGYSIAELSSFLVERFAANAIFSAQAIGGIKKIEFCDCLYDSIYRTKGIIGITLNGLHGIWKNGKELIPPSYEQPLIFINDSLIIAKKNGKEGILKNNVPVTDFKYPFGSLVYNKYADIFEVNDDQYDGENVLIYISAQDFKEYKVTANDEAIIKSENWNYDFGRLWRPDPSYDLILIEGDSIIPESSLLNCSEFEKNSSYGCEHIIVIDPKWQSELINFKKKNCKYYSNNLHTEHTYIREIELIVGKDSTLMYRYYDVMSGKVAFAVPFVEWQEYYGLGYEYLEEEGVLKFTCTSNKVYKKWDDFRPYGARKTKTIGYVDEKNHGFYKSKKKLLKARK